ncbi:hypothetical protein D3C86_1846450 [compost metagenome]
MIAIIRRDRPKKLALQPDCALQIDHSLGAIPMAYAECFNKVDDALHGAAVQDGNGLLPEDDLHITPVRLRHVIL